MNFLVATPQIAGVRGDEPAFDPSTAIRVVVQVLQRDHLSRKPLSDKLSEQWLTAFLHALDPARMYFLDEDIAEFRAWGKQRGQACSVENLASSENHDVEGQRS